MITSIRKEYLKPYNRVQIDCIIYEYLISYPNYGLNNTTTVYRIHISLVLD